MASQTRTAFFAGVRACLPAFPGVLAFSMICSASMVAAGMPPVFVLATGVLVFAGTMQLVGVQLLAAGAPMVVIGLAATIVNLRFVMFGLSLERYLRSEPPALRALMAYMMSDNGYACAISRYMQHPDAPSRAAYYIGANMVVWVGWQVAAVLGVVLGAQIPAAWHLEFCVTLTFLALAITSLRDRPTLAAALTAGTVAVLARGLPLKLGLILASVAGIAAGALYARWTRAR